MAVSTAEKEFEEYIHTSMSYVFAAADLLKNQGLFNGVGVFCLRHAIELLQKGIILSIKHDLYITHDLKILHVRIKERWGLVTFNKNTIKSFNEMISPDDPQASFSRVERYQLFRRAILSKLEKIAQRYTNHQYVGGNFPDKKNTKLRYPQDVEFHQRFTQAMKKPKVRKLIGEDIDDVIFLALSFIDFSDR